MPEVFANTETCHSLRLRLPRFQMVFDALPIYFDYRGRTWLIELWKGQYGINTGAELGIYHADKILSESEYKTALFTAAEDNGFRKCCPARYVYAATRSKIVTIFPNATGGSQSSCPAVFPILPIFVWKLPSVSRICKCVTPSTKRYAGKDIKQMTSPYMGFVFLSSSVLP